MTSPLPSRRAVATAALGLLAAGFVPGCAPSLETNPAGEPGDTRELDAGDRGGASFTVAMPDGTYTVTDVAVHSSVGPEARRLVAPEGAVIVSLDVGDSVGQSHYPLGHTRSIFQVVAGGETYSMESSGVSRGAGVVIPGDGSDAVIEVAHEGRTARFAVADGERLDEEPLYATSDTHVADERLPQDEDGKVEFVDGDYGPEISARMVHHTYSSEAGWAPKGSAWLEAYFIGFSRPGMGISGEGWVDVVGTVTSVRLIVDGTAVETDSELTPERVLLAWAVVPLAALQAALEITYDLTINGEAVLSGGTHTLEEMELAGLTV